MLISVRVGIGQLDQQRRSLRTFTDCLEFDLEQSLHHVCLANIPIHEPRCSKRFHERRVQVERVLEMRESLEAQQELLIKKTPQTQMAVCLRDRVRLAGKLFFQLVRKSLPIMYCFEMIQTLRKIHGFLGPWPGLRKALQSMSPTNCQN